MNCIIHPLELQPDFKSLLNRNTRLQEKIDRAFDRISAERKQLDRLLGEQREVLCLLDTLDSIQSKQDVDCEHATY